MARRPERHPVMRGSPDMRAHPFSQSSMISRIGFDDDAGILSISFRDTGTYLYYDVPAETFEAFCHAASAGSFFNELIKDRFRYARDPERRRFGPNA
ncbi:MULTISPECIES: KTSC domain-containing protein [Sphingomonadaceae]|jgi:hypothetical protein|nr:MULTISPECIES: KTSC domain-containing protein [Sphingomonadaceae]WQE08865.1 KTSC domain-containing protein [Sphingobium yanoikuyae]